MDTTKRGANQPRSGHGGWKKITDEKRRENLLRRHYTKLEGKVIWLKKGESARIMNDADIITVKATKNNLVELVAAVGDHLTFTKTELRKQAKWELEQFAHNQGYLS